MKNIACNLIYNNGGEGDFVGFYGRCTEDIIIYNIKKGSGRWCSNDRCSCKKYYNNGFKGKINEFPCNESILFKNWEFSAGENFEDEEKVRMLHVGANKIAILTTTFANTREEERKIIGFFKIDNVSEDLNIVTASNYYRLRLSLEDSKELNFWNYYINNKNSKTEWKQRRFRYLEDEQVACILHDLLDIVRNDDDHSMIKKLLKSDFKKYSESKPKIKSALSENIGKKALLKRKYGSGGESENHKKLKKYVANNPEIIGLLPEETEAKIEHSFLSGDLVDILFIPKSGELNTVVEIELDNVMPGIHQAIKYRALRCSQLGIQLNDNRVRAVVVAWKFSEDEINLCKKYSINYFIKKI